MKKILKSAIIFVLSLFTFVSCNEDNYKLETEFSQLGELLSPSSGEQLVLDIENGSNVEFTWSQSTSVDGGLVIYEVLFDEEGGDFSEPISSFLSKGNGGGTNLDLQQVYLNIAASKGGIQQLESGNIIWTVRATSSFNQTLYDDVGTINITRPEGLAVFPDYMYIYGSATEGADTANGVAFKQISSRLPYDNIEPGVFESITKLKTGEFFIVNTNDPNAPDLTTFYVNSEGKIRQSDTPTSISIEEGVYRIRMNLAKSTISYELMEDLELYILANQITKANFQYIGNHTFEATDGYFDFLTPGAPEAPSWLGWEEERYKFKYLLDGTVSYIGSYHNDALNASLVPGFDGYGGRPNGGEPEGYFSVFFLGPDAGYWQGAYKFSDAYNGKAFTCRMIFDPKADEYYHEFSLN
ncbi:SusE domain-containing protein [Flavivirga sp. 57AJ16]|uniref:SusE domain-containing protein n=1 Tax=Flavivirga sp. 57AJ16 TaxID=3025307 RepID=UPI002367358D|nr:SusE domain-containing protein [Flavivirga sp. 57AJ16]MDD7884500.1 SusE domain-containing protein [Flavivirga sp. 57AJ16]